MNDKIGEALQSAWSVTPPMTNPVLPNPYVFGQTN